MAKYIRSYIYLKKETLSGPQDWNGHSHDIRSRVLEFSDDRHDYGEERLIAIGMVKGRVIVVVSVDRNGGRRLISARKATTDEAKIYFETCFGHAYPTRHR